MSHVLAIADDGTRIVVGLDPNGGWLYAWGENDEGRFLLGWFSISRFGAVVEVEYEREA